MKQIPYARLVLRDVQDLDAASERLAIVANALSSAKYANGPALVKLLAESNDSIERIKAKGAAAIARHLERQGVIAAPDELELPLDQVEPQNEDVAAAAAEG